MSFIDFAVLLLFAKKGYDTGFIGTPHALEKFSVQHVRTGVCRMSIFIIIGIFSPFFYSTTHAFLLIFFDKLEV